MVEYDGLVGLSQHNILADMAAWYRTDSPAWVEFLSVIKTAVRGRVDLYFSDYVSYGVGGGDATSPQYFGSYILRYVGPSHPLHGFTADERLVLFRTRSSPADGGFARLTVRDPPPFVSYLLPTEIVNLAGV